MPTKVKESKQLGIFSGYGDCPGLRHVTRCVLELEPCPKNLLVFPTIELIEEATLLCVTYIGSWLSSEKFECIKAREEKMLWPFGAELSKNPSLFIDKVGKAGAFSSWIALRVSSKLRKFFLEYWGPEKPRLVEVDNGSTQNEIALASYCPNSVILNPCGAPLRD